jgi:excisionase family DNA binding protein
MWAASKGTRRNHSSFMSDLLPHQSHEALFFTCACTWPVGGEADGVPLPESRCTMVNNPGDYTDQKFLTVAEVAAMMRVSKMTVYRLVHSGELPAVRVGRSFRVTEEDVDEYLRKSFYSAG